VTEATDAQVEEPASAAAVLQLANRPLSRGGRPWPKGVSGNPKGRPLRTYATAERIRAALVEELPEILAKVVSAARAGDMAAARLICDRVLPAIKPVEIPVVMSPLTGTLPEQGAALLTAMTRGEIAPAQCASLLMGLGANVRAVEVDNMTRRLDAIEQKLADADASRPEPR
jgi:hypothetical protein